MTVFQPAESFQAIVIGNDDHVCGLIVVTDTIRADASHSIAQLKAVGIKHVVVLTGDNRGTAEAVGNEMRVDEVRSQLLPGDKVTAMDELLARYKYVAMVGDGVNDAPAMARASLGSAMGIAGTDMAIETADVAPMSDNLSRIAWSIGHSRRTLAIIRQNIIALLAVKLVFVVDTLRTWLTVGSDRGRHWHVHRRCIQHAATTPPR
jgi:Cd2+/Zn2+-exporting ATPase